MWAMNSLSLFLFLYIFLLLSSFATVNFFTLSNGAISPKVNSNYLKHLFKASVSCFSYETINTTCAQFQKPGSPWHIQLILNNQIWQHNCTMMQMNMTTKLKLHSHIRKYIFGFLLFLLFSESVCKTKSKNAESFKQTTIYYCKSSGFCSTKSGYFHSMALCIPLIVSSKNICRVWLYEKQQDMMIFRFKDSLVYKCVRIRFRGSCSYEMSSMRSEKGEKQQPKNKQINYKEKKYGDKCSAQEWEHQLRN